MGLMGKRIRQKRLENNMSLEELGDILGVKKTAVSKWELGEVENIRRSSIEKMADVFQVEPQWLMGFGPDNDTASDVDYDIATKNGLIHLTKSSKAPSKVADLYMAASLVLPENRDAAIRILKSLS